MGWSAIVQTKSKRLQLRPTARGPDPQPSPAKACLKNNGNATGRGQSCRERYQNAWNIDRTGWFCRKIASLSVGCFILMLILDDFGALGVSEAHKCPFKFNVFLFSLRCAMLSPSFITRCPMSLLLPLISHISRSFGDFFLHGQIFLGPLALVQWAMSVFSAPKPHVQLDGVTTLRPHVFCMSLSVKGQRIHLRRLQSHGNPEAFLCQATVPSLDPTPCA